MIITAIIEIPRGDDRRRHVNTHNKSEFVDLGPMRDHILVNGGIAPEHYGFVPDTHNPNDEDDVDVLVFSEHSAHVGQMLDVRPIALLKRTDGDEKVVAVEPGSPIQTWEELDGARRELVLAFYGSHHTITSVKNAKAAEQYIRDSRVN